MGTVSDELTYLNGTKTKLKDVINLTEANITSETTFRNYAKALYDGYINVLKDKGTLLDNMPKETSTGYITNAADLPVYESKMSKVSTQKTTTGKNLFSGDFSQFDNVGGTGTTYSYFKLPDDNYNYTLTLTAKNTITIPNNVYFGITTNGGHAGGGYHWVVKQGDSIVAGQKYSDSSSSTLRFISMYANTVNTLNYLIENFYIQLEKGTSSTDYEPYTNGASPNPDYPQEIDTVKGYRNLAGPINGSVVSNGIEVKAVNSEILINGTSTSANTFSFIGQNIARPSQYYQALTLTTENSIKLTPGTYVLSYNASNVTFLRLYGNLGDRLDACTSISNGVPFTINEDKYVWLGVYIANGVTVNTSISNIQLIEGTKEKPYISYGSNYVLKKIVGFNLWDEEWELGTINTTTGENTPNNNNIRSKNYIEIFENKTCYVKAGSSNSIWLAIETYDENKKFISNLGGISNGGNFTPPNNCKYIRFYVSGVYGTTYNNDICINVSDTQLNGTYESYQETIVPIPLNNNEIAGIGNYKDELIVDKNGHCWLNKKIGKVDLSTLNWEQYSSKKYYSLSLDGYIAYVPSGVAVSALCEKYVTVASTSTLKNGELAVGTISSKSRIYVYDTSGTPSGNMYYPLLTENLIDLNYNVDLSLFKGVNNISNSEDMDMEIKYILENYEEGE